MKISRTVKISNADGNATVTNYYAIAQSQDAADAQWVRMTSDQLTIRVSQRTESGCVYALVYRDLNGNGVYEEGVDALCDRNSFASGSTEFTVSFGDADGDTISDSCELREGTDPLDRWSYCYAPSVRIDGIIRTTNDLTCVARFGTNVILAATFLTNETFEASFETGLSACENRHCDYDDNIWVLTHAGDLLNSESINVLQRIELCDWNKSEPTDGIIVDSPEDFYLGFMSTGDNAWDGIDRYGWFHVGIDQNLDMFIIDSGVGLYGESIYVGIGPIPEPTSGLLFLLGVAGLALRRRLREGRQEGRSGGVIALRGQIGYNTRTNEILSVCSGRCSCLCGAGRR